MIFLRVFITLFLFSFLTASSVAGQEKLEIIPLKNRLVEEVIPTIRSILGQRGTVTGMQGQLIIRADPKALEEVKLVLGKIDSALKNLQITVKQRSRLRLNELEKSVAADIPIGNDERIILGKPGLGGVILENETGRGKVRGRLLDRSRNTDELDTQFITTLEGQLAVIYIVQLIPIKEIRILRSGDQATEVETVIFKEVRTGLNVLPKLKGNQVILEISPQKARLNGQAIETFGINTVVRGQIGEWMELGGVTQDRKRSNAGIGNRAASQDDQSRKVFFKVDYQ